MIELDVTGIIRTVNPEIYLKENKRIMTREAATPIGGGMVGALKAYTRTNFDGGVAYAGTKYGLQRLQHGKGWKEISKRVKKTKRSLAHRMGLVYAYVIGTGDAYWLRFCFGGTSTRTTKKGKNRGRIGKPHVEPFAMLMRRFHSQHVSRAIRANSKAHDIAARKPKVERI